MLNAFDILEFRTAGGVFYDCLACKKPIFSICEYLSVSCFIQFLIQFQSFQRNIIVAFFDLHMFFFFVKVYIDLVQLFMSQTPRNKFMNENVRVVKKIKMEFFCTRNRSMTIPTVRNVEHGKSFVLIGCGSRNSKRVKSYGRLKKATGRSSIRSDGIGKSRRSPRNARACSHCSTRYLRYYRSMMV